LTTDVFSSQGRLDAALADLERFRIEWESEDCPSLAEGSMGQQVPHPLIKLIRDAERAVEMLSRPAAAKRGGRPAGKSSAPDRQPTKLRAVS
jgi:hypothetical protein